MTEPRASGKPVDYRCAMCGWRVAVVAGQILRACGHAEAGVTAGLTATVYSESKVSG